ncbi:MAG: hypothetical protein Tsb002_37390 [Wenzhouxiangellaceae bacterium]
MVTLLWCPLLSASAQDEQRYQQELTIIRDMAAEADFTALRRAAAGREVVVEQREEIDRQRQLAFAAMDQGQFEECAERAVAALALDYTQLRAHHAAMVCFLQSDDIARGQYHQWVMQGLIESITASGDGRRPDTAYAVINENERSGFLTMMGYRRALSTEGSEGAVAVIDPETNQPRQVYFQRLQPLAAD